MTIVLTHNLWTNDWRSLISAFGWFAIFVGAVRILFSREVSKKGAQMIAKPATLPTVATALLVLGGIFTYYGYFA